MTRRRPWRRLNRVSLEIVVPAAEAGKKLGNFLKSRFPIGYVRKLFRRNGLRVNGKRVAAEEPVHAGDRIWLYIPFEKSTRRAPSAPPGQPEITAIYEDDDLLVVNKPAGVAVHEGKQVARRRSVIGALENRYRTQGVSPRLVHRLDKDTSGVLIVAKNDSIRAELETLFAEEKDIRKEYVCLLVGRLQDDRGTIDFPLAGRDGKPVRAVTRYQVLQRFTDTTLARVHIETGRMHQIRLHFARFGYPIIMDDQHGDFKLNKRFRKAYGLKRQFLHAARLELEYHGQKRVWTAPLAEDLQHVLDRLRAAESR